MTTQVSTGSTSGWVGWIVFAAVMMILDGIFQFIVGLTAIINPHWFVIHDQSVLFVNLHTWGWVHLIISILVIIAGAALFSGNTAARIFAVVLAGLSAIDNLAFLGVYPFWSLVVITIDVLVIYALIVHGGELKQGRV